MHANSTIIEMRPITITFILLVVAGPLCGRMQCEMDACNKEIKMQVIFAFEQAMVGHLRKDFFYSAPICIKCGVVNFFCWEPALGAVALDAGRQGLVEQGAQFFHFILYRYVLRSVVRWVTHDPLMWMKMKAARVVRVPPDFKVMIDTDMWERCKHNFPADS